MSHLLIVSSGTPNSLAMAVPATSDSRREKQRRGLGEACDAAAVFNPENPPHPRPLPEMLDFGLNRVDATKVPQSLRPCVPGHRLQIQPGPSKLLANGGRATMSLGDCCTGVKNGGTQSQRWTVSGASHGGQNKLRGHFRCRLAERGRVGLHLTPYIRVLVAANWAGLAYCTPANYPVYLTK